MMCAALDPNADVGAVAPDPAVLASLERELPQLRALLAGLPTFRPMLESLAVIPHGPALMRHLEQSGALARWVAETAAALAGRDEEGHDEL
jgi:hypothetical protein